MTAKEKAAELISDYLEILPTSLDFASSYEVAKTCALYAANTAKWSHEPGTKNFIFCEEIKQEIKNL